MYSNLIVLTASAITSFVLCCSVAQFVTKALAPTHWIFAEMHTAFSFMDSRVLVTFLAGLLCSVALMYVWGAFTSVKPALNNDEWRAFKLIQRIAVSKSTSMYVIVTCQDLWMQKHAQASVASNTNATQIPLRNSSQVWPARGTACLYARDDSGKICHALLHAHIGQ